MYFHYMYPMYITWLRITSGVLLRLSQSLLTDTDSWWANYRCGHVHWNHSRCPGIGWLRHWTHTRLYWIRDTVYNSIHGYWTLYTSVYMDTEHCIDTIWWQYDNYIIINIGMKHRHKSISKCFYFLRIYRLRKYFMMH